MIKSMKSFLEIILLIFADIIGALLGFVLAIVGFMFLTGMYCHVCMGTMPWFAGPLLLSLGLVFLMPNSLFRILTKRLSLHLQIILSLSRALVTTAFMLIVSYTVILNGLPFWLLIIALSKLISSFVLALELERSKNRKDSEPLITQQLETTLQFFQD